MIYVMIFCRSTFQKRADKAEKNRTLAHLRAPVVCVLGHVDTGKTKILDKVGRYSLVAQAKAGMSDWAQVGSVWS